MIIDLIQELANLQDAYSLEKRNLITIDRYQDLIESNLILKEDYTNSIVQETLIEHVGHLPILATYFHPHIEHSRQVNLGKSLQMLALHDIGETVVGDVYTYTKNAEDEKAEYEAAIKIIHPSQTKIYEEYTTYKTFESLYAKSIDALAPLIHSISMASTTLKHAKLHGVTVDLVVEQKAQYFIWDTTLKEIFDICIEHYQRVEKGKEPIFIQKI